MHNAIVIQAILLEIQLGEDHDVNKKKNRAKAVGFDRSAPGEARTLAFGSGGRRSIH